MAGGENAGRGPWNETGPALNSYFLVRRANRSAASMMSASDVMS